MSRKAISTWCFAVVIVRLDDRFLLVHERKHGQRWYVPAGRVEPGETLAEAARRETLEESGVEVELDGILRIEHTLIQGGARLRVIYSAHPLGDSTPKRVADDDTLGAAWVSLDELKTLPLRGPEVATMLHDVARGAPVYPLSLITREGAPLI